MFNTKKSKLKKLKGYLTILNEGYFPDGYIQTHQHRIACLEWLVEYYSGKTSSTPQEMFETLISKSTPTIGDCHWATTLWYWIHKGEIYGF
jgi:hypothetical protein